MMDWTPAPGAYSAPGVLTDFMVGPHSLFVRNGLVLNDRTMLEGFWVEDMTGFDSADIRVSASENSQEEGEIAEPGLPGGRTMTLTGYVYAGSYLQVERLGRQLLDSFIGLAERPLVITTIAAQIGIPVGVFNIPEVSIYCRPADKLMLSAKIEQSDTTGVFKIGRAHV